MSMRAVLQKVRSYLDLPTPVPLEPSEERGSIVTFLYCEAFEKRYTPEVASALREVAEDIRRGRHLYPAHEMPK